MQGIHAMEFLLAIERRKIEGLDPDRFINFLYSIQPADEFVTTLAPCTVATARQLPYGIVELNYLLTTAHARSSSLDWKERFMRKFSADDLLLQLRGDDEVLEVIRGSKRPYALLGRISHYGNDPLLMKHQPLLLVPGTNDTRIHTWEKKHTLYERERTFLPNKRLEKIEYELLIA
jgi:hypothetical protein